jgi:hypothetical protein
MRISGVFIKIGNDPIKKPGNHYDYQALKYLSLPGCRISAAILRPDN